MVGNLVAFLETLSPWGNACSILGLFLSIGLLLRTGKIKENVDNALEKNNKIINYISMREEILKGLSECTMYLVNEHSPSEQLPYLQKLDRCLAELIVCYPNMTADMKKDIEVVRSSCNGIGFSFIKIITPLNNILSVLRTEAIKL